MDHITHQMRREQWTQIINACLSSGLSKKQWMAQNGIDEKRFYYWQRVLRKEAYPLATTSEVGSDMVEIIPCVSPVATTPQREETSPLIIRCGNLSLEVSDGTSMATLRAVLEVLRHA